MATTLTDIASKLNIAPSTVSLVLRDHPGAKGFNPNLRKRIKNTARKMNYHPNLFASGLSGKHSKLLMLCLNSLRDTWASAIAQSFELQAAGRGYRVLVSAFHNKEDPMTFNRDILGSQGVGAMVVIGSNRDKLTDDAIVQLANQGVKVVLVSREIEDERVGCVLPDNEGGAKLAADHLYDQGLDNVWLLNLQQQQSIARRINSFLDMASEKNMPKPTVLVANAKDHIGSSYEAVKALLNRGPAPQGLFAGGDIMAVGAVQAFHEYGLTVGKDVAVVGFDGGIYSECCSPRLTSVYQPTEQMGKESADMLINMLEASYDGSSLAQVNNCPIRKIVPLELKIRKSSVLGESANKGFASKKDSNVDELVAA